MEKGTLLYTGKAKEMFSTDDENMIWVHYLNQATALNGKKKDQIAGKGALNNQITSEIFEVLNKNGISSHFIKRLSETEQLVKKVTIIPLEVVVRNVAAGSFAKKFGVPEGTTLDNPIVEFYFKSDALDDPFINDVQAEVLGIVSTAEIDELKFQALQINDSLQALFQAMDIRLIDFKVEFGKLPSGEILLADEISPDTCRLWNLADNAHLDKDIYRRDLGDLIPVYEEVLKRLNKVMEDA